MLSLILSELSPPGGAEIYFCHCSRDWTASYLITVSARGRWVSTLRNAKAHGLKKGWLADRQHPVSMCVSVRYRWAGLELLSNRRDRIENT